MAIGVVSSRQLGDARMLFEIVELFRCHGRLDFATGIARSSFFDTDVTR